MNHLMRNQFVLVLVCLALIRMGPLAAPSVAVDRSQESPVPSRLSFDKPQSRTWQVGVRITTTGSTCNEAYATFPVPSEWPEQSIRLDSQEISEYVSRWTTRQQGDGPMQVLVWMKNIPPNTLSNALFTFEITKQRIGAPSETADLVKPPRIGRDLKSFMGKSPYIDPRHPRIRQIVGELQQTASPNDWSYVERVYDWVRDNIRYEEGDIKDAAKAIEDGFGDCEELTSAFVAICRASNIPARMVWVPGHCYPEFALQDAEGNNHWFPCQVAGTRQFGEMEEYKPILQKGDRFKVPEKRSVQRYLAEHCKLNAKTKPSVGFVRKLTDPED